MFLKSGLIEYVVNNFLNGMCFVVCGFIFVFVSFYNDIANINLFYCLNKVGIKIV